MNLLFDSVHQLMHLPEAVEKLTRGGGYRERDESDGGWGSVPVDILETQKSYSFFLDVPGLSKSDVQVTLEDENILVVKSNNNNNKGGKRKRDEVEEEGCKYLRLERKPSLKFVRKFQTARRLQSVCDHCQVSEWGVDSGGGQVAAAAAAAGGGQAKDCGGQDRLTERRCCCCCLDVKYK